MLMHAHATQVQYVHAYAHAHDYAHAHAYTHVRVYARGSLNFQFPL